MSGALDFTLNDRVYDMSDQQKEDVLLGIINEAAVRTSFAGDDAAEKLIREVMDRELKK